MKERIERILAVALIAAAIVTAGRMAHGALIYDAQTQQYVDTGAPDGTPVPTHTPDPQDCLHGDHTGDPHCPTSTPTETPREATATEVPVPSETPTPTATPTTCIFHCDCDGSGAVSIGEIIKAVNFFLGDPITCASIDSNGSGTVSIGEVVQCVNNFLGTCP